MAQKKIKPKGTKIIANTRKSAGRPKNPISKFTLIEIASILFAEQGYDGTTLDDIASIAKITKPSVLYHFPSKETLYMEILNFYISKMLKLIIDAVVGVGTFEKRLDALGEVMVDFLGNNPPLARLLVRESTGNGLYFHKHGYEKIQHALELTFRFLRSGISNRTMSDDAVRSLVISIMGVHIFYFAMPEISTPFMNASPFDKKEISARKEVVKRQVRLLCECHNELDSQQSMVPKQH